MCRPRYAIFKVKNTPEGPSLQIVKRTPFLSNHLSLGRSSYLPLGRGSSVPGSKASHLCCRTTKNRLHPEDVEWFYRVEIPFFLLLTESVLGDVRNSSS